MQAVGRLPKQEKQKDIGLVRKLIKSVSGVLLPPKRRTAIANRLPRTIAAYAGLSERCESLVEHPWFDAFILFCIVLVGFATFVEMEFGAERGVMSIVLAYVQQVTLTVFTLEVLFKVVACGEDPMKFFDNPEDGAFNLCVLPSTDLQLVTTSCDSRGAPSPAPLPLPPGPAGTIRSSSWSRTS